MILSTLIVLWVGAASLEFGLLFFSSLSMHAGGIEDRIGCGMLIAVPIVAVVVSILLLTGVIPPLPTERSHT